MPINLNQQINVILSGLDARISTLEGAMPSPSVTISAAVSHAEGNTGTTAFIYTLTLARNGSTASFPFTWAVTGTGGSPANAADFGGTFPSGSGTFASGETSKTITILASGDITVETDETFLLTVTTTGLNTVTVVGTITNDDAATISHLGTVGVNLAGADAYGRTFPFLNRFKTMREWSQGTFTIDSKGYADNTAGTTLAAFGIEEPGMRPVTTADPTPNRWVVKWTGTGTCTVDDTTTVGTPTSNRLVFDNPAYTPGQNDPYTRFLRITGSPKDIAIVPLADEALYDAGTTWFNPPYLELVKRWTLIRDMDWMNTNSSTRTDFTTRPPVDYATWASYRGDAPLTPPEVPLEVVLRLAHEAGTKILHHCSPVRYTDAALTAELTFLKANLPTGCVLRHEFSNEIWNDPTAATQYAYTQGALLPDEGIPRHIVWAGKRAAEAATIARGIFSGADAARLRTAIGVQSGRTEIAPWKEFGAKKVSGVTRLADIFDNLLIAPYVRANLNGNNDTDRNTIMAKATANDIAWFLNQLEHGGTLTATDESTVDTLCSTEIPYWETYCAANDLTPACYELGFEQVPQAFFYEDHGYTVTQRDQLTNALITALDTTTAGAMVTRLLTALRTASFYGNAYFFDIGGRNQFGIWGARASTYVGGGRDDALAGWEAAPTTPATLTITAPTPLTLTNGASTSRKVTAAGGYPKRAISLTSGAVPGMTFNARLGQLTGTPSTNGNFPVTIAVTDISGATTSVSPTFVVAAPPSFRYYKLIVTNRYALGNLTPPLPRQDNMRELYVQRPDGTRPTQAWLASSSEGGLGPENLTDGNQATQWSYDYDNDNPFPHVFATDCGTAEPFGSLFIQSADGGYSAPPSDFTLYGRNTPFAVGTGTSPDTSVAGATLLLTVVGAGASDYSPSPDHIAVFDS